MGKYIGKKEHYYYRVIPFYRCFVLSKTTLFIGIDLLIAYAALSACFFVFFGTVVPCVYSFFCRYAVWAKLPKNKGI